MQILTNPEPELFVTDFPKELQEYILLNLDDKSLTNAFLTNAVAASIFRNDEFWNQRIQFIYGVNLSKEKEKDKTYREIYNNLRKCNRERLLT